MTKKYQICVRCIMDTTDPDISFDENGVCNHCHQHDFLISKLPAGVNADKKLEQIVEQIKRAGRGKEYDCVIGVSGGVDSTFVALKAREFGLRPLAVHLDNGWDSELAVSNIQKTLDKLSIELYTYVIDWEEFKDLQLSFLYASTPDSEIPSDHAIASIMRQMASQIGVGYILAGDNVRTETHLPAAWSQGHRDWKYVYSIQKMFGHRELKSFPHMDFLTYNRYRLTQKLIEILNYVDYSKKDTLPILEKELGWQYYGGKHYESIYTRFYQGYILPKKFGYDKRRSHLSSVICAGEITREEALVQISDNPYPEKLQQEDREYVIKKFDLTDSKFDEIMRLPIKSFWDYPSYEKFYANPIYRNLRAVYRNFNR